MEGRTEETGQDRAVSRVEAMVGGITGGYGTMGGVTVDVRSVGGVTVGVRIVGGVTGGCGNFGWSHWWIELVVRR